MTRFRHTCSEHGCYLTTRWDSHSVGQAARESDGRWPFPRNISPTDIDGFMECAGQLLFIETKRAGQVIPRGQRIALEAIAAAGHSVLVQECEVPSKDSVVRMAFLTGDSRRPVPWEQMDRLGRDRRIQDWFAIAETRRKAA